MTYLLRSRASGEINEVESSEITEESFTEFEVYHSTPMSKEHFEEEMKKFQIMDLQMQQQILQQKLQELMTQGTPAPVGDPSVATPSAGPAFPPLNNQIAPVAPVANKMTTAEGTTASTSSVSMLESKVPQVINPKTNKPYTQAERDELFVKFSEDMERTSEEIIFCENNGDHFVAVVASKHPGFPKNVGGIPIVQMTEEEHMQMR
jgi:hypothetical protein